MTFNDSTEPGRVMKTADSVFYELTRTMCPECREIINGEIPSDKLYEKRKPVLDEEWAKVAGEVPGGA